MSEPGMPGIGMLGIWMFGKPGIVGDDDGRDVVLGPGSVVIATVPSVVREQPEATPARISAAAVTRTCVFICATIGASET